MGLLKVFSQIDMQNDDKLTLAELRRGFKDCRVELTDNETIILFKIFQEQPKFTNYRDMIRDLIGQMTTNRLTLIKHVFQLIDSEQQHIITI